MSKNRIAALPSVEEMGQLIRQKQDEIEANPELKKELVEGHPSGNPITLGPRLPSPSDWAKNQVKGVGDNAEKWLKNTLAPKKNFKEEAIKAEPAYKNAMQRVIATDAHAKAMAQVDESAAHEVIRQGGSTPYTSGVAKRQAKIQKAIERDHSARLALASTIDGMPTGTDAEREAKMIANKRGLQAVKNTRLGVG